MSTKKTLVIGASENLSRYSNKAVQRLRDKGHDVIAVGQHAGIIGDIIIQTGLPEIKNIDTVTLYIRPEIQKIYSNYILALKPQRVIFNPGTENEAFEKELMQSGIETVEACTLVLLSIGSY